MLGGSTDQLECTGIWDYCMNLWIYGSAYTNLRGCIWIYTMDFMDLQGYSVDLWICIQSCRVVVGLHTVYGLSGLSMDLYYRMDFGLWTLRICVAVHMDCLGSNSRRQHT